MSPSVHFWNFKNMYTQYGLKGCFQILRIMKYIMFFRKLKGVNLGQAGRKKNEKKTIGVQQIVRQISTMSGISQAHVRVVFQCYSNFIKKFWEFENALDDVEAIIIPYIGKIIFKKKEGRKKGSMKPIFVRGEDGKSVRKEIILEKDEPDYYVLYLKPSDVLNNNVKESTRKINRKRVIRKLKSEIYEKI